MGAENSKPASDVSQHVFSSYVALPRADWLPWPASRADTVLLQRHPRPILQWLGRFAAEEHTGEKRYFRAWNGPWTDALATQTDSTRSKQQELQYQQRLSQELEKLREKEAQNLSELSKTLDVEQPAESTSLTDTLSDVTEKISDATSSSATLAEKRRQQDMSNSTVTKAGHAEKARAGRPAGEQGQGRCCRVLAPARPAAARLLERGRDLQEGGRPAGEGLRGEDDKMSAVRYPSNTYAGTFLRAPDCTDKIHVTTIPPQIPPGAPVPLIFVVLVKFVLFPLVYSAGSKA
jgi:hypothetical protein